MKYEKYKKEWKQVYAGKWSLITCSYLGEKHTRIIKKVLGFGLNHNIIILKKGVCASYYEEKDFEKFGRQLGEYAVKNNKDVIKWCSEVKKLTDEIIGLIKNKSTLKNYNKFLTLFYDYVPSYVAMKQVVNFIPKKLAEKLLPVLRETRIYAEPLYTETEKFMVRISKEIGKKNSYKPELILAMVKEEFDDYLRNGKLPKKEVLEKRYEKSALIFYQGGYKLITGKEVDELEKVMYSAQGDYVKGMCAYQGKVIGKVRIVTDPEMKNFEDGGILVTGMTRPEFIVLMEKSAAVVTDAGGLLCHAAIVARELKKPTVIGTEKATKVFKDGDLVEVDAEKGIVRKIR